MVRVLQLGLLVVALVGLPACFGRIEGTSTAHTLPFHDSEANVRDYSRASVKPPEPLTVQSTVTFVGFVGYYPLPVGMSASDPAYNAATNWSPIKIEPAPEVALKLWFERTIHGGGGPRRIVQAVVTDFQWYMLGFVVNGGRIATQVVVTDENGGVVYSGTHVTRARVPFVDALFRAHTRDWLKDKKFLAALQGGR